MKYERFFETHSHMACTLGESDIGTHSSGWTITGEVMCDYYSWVNYFEAEHPLYGIVKGDFEVLVQADSEEAFNHFVENHPPHEWDYWDI